MEHRCFYINFIVVVELRYGQRKDVLCIIITTLRLNLYIMCASSTTGQVRLAESIEHPLLMLEVTRTPLCLRPKLGAYIRKTYLNNSFTRFWTGPHNIEFLPISPKHYFGNGILHFISGYVKSPRNYFFWPPFFIGLKWKRGVKKGSFIDFWKNHWWLASHVASENFEIQEHIVVKSKQERSFSEPS